MYSAESSNYVSINVTQQICRRGQRKGRADKSAAGTAKKLARTASLREKVYQRRREGHRTSISLLVEDFCFFLVYVEEQLPSIIFYWIMSQLFLDDHDKFHLYYFFKLVPTRLVRPVLFFPTEYLALEQKILSAIWFVLISIEFFR